MKRMSDLTEKQILALSISNEEEDSKIYSTLAHSISKENEEVAEMLRETAKEELDHKNTLMNLYKKRFGKEIPYITREDIADLQKPEPIWLLDSISIESAQEYVKTLEHNAWQFYDKAAKLTINVDTRKLLLDLALTEQEHKNKAYEYGSDKLSKKKKKFLLTVVQPGLIGLIDGSISTLAPVFAAAFATRNPKAALLVGLASSIGGGISMGITEGISDDGELTGRGCPWIRGVICGFMTFIGGLGHTLPYLIHDFHIASYTSIVVVLIELSFISAIKQKYMKTPFMTTVIQIVAGGILVLLSGILTGLL